MGKFRIFQFNERTINGVEYVDIRVDNTVVFLTKYSDWHMLLYLYTTDDYYNIGLVKDDFVKKLIKESKEYQEYVSVFKNQA
jgi:hypothetical protein